MRKLIVLDHISLDGVIQAPGGVEEDTSGGFAYGGWITPYYDERLNEVLMQKISPPLDLLLGRKTFKIWEAYWPLHSEEWPAIKTATRYVASNTVTHSDWQPSVFLNGAVEEKIAALKQQEGPDLHVWGSSVLMQTLLKHDLVDAFWLMIFPITLGRGKRLFSDAAMPLAFTLTDSLVSSKGVVVVNYERAGDIPKRVDRD